MEILSFLRLDISVYLNGFSQNKQMFEWICSSPFCHIRTLSERAWSDRQINKTSETRIVFREFFQFVRSIPTPQTAIRSSWRGRGAGRGIWRGSRNQWEEPRHWIGLTQEARLNAVLSFIGERNQDNSHIALLDINRACQILRWTNIRGLAHICMIWGAIVLKKPSRSSTSQVTNDEELQAQVLHYQRELSQIEPSTSPTRQIDSTLRQPEISPVEIGSYYLTPEGELVLIFLPGSHVSQ